MTEFTPEGAQDYKSPLSPLSPDAEGQKPMLNLKERLQDAGEWAKDEELKRKIDQAVDNGTMGQLEKQVNTKSPKNPNA